jgi:hypothetical protein
VPRSNTLHCTLHKQYVPTSRRQVIGFLTKHNHVLGKVSQPYTRIGGYIVREARKIKELQRTLFSNSAIVRPQSLAVDIKFKISHFYTFVLFRETYNIIGRYYKTRVSPQVTRHIYFSGTRFMCIIYTIYALVTCKKCVNRKKTYFRVSFDAIVIYS